MRQTIKFTKKTLIWIGILAVLWVAGSAAWLLNGRLNGLKLKYLEIIPVPLALVENQPVFAQDYLEAEQIGQSAGVTGQSQIFDAAIRLKKYQVLLKNLGLKPINGDLPQNSLSGLSDFAASDNGLRLYYNSQAAFNAETYAKADDLLKKTVSGEAFSSLAQTYSQDAFSKNFGGKAGVVDLSQLPSELLGPVSQMKPGETKIIPSRLGLHIIRLENLPGNHPELSQIFLNLDGYQAWLEKNLNALKTKIIIKP